MYYAGTVIDCDIISGDNSKGTCGKLDKTVFAHCKNCFGMLIGIFANVCRTISVQTFARTYPRHKLLITHAYKFGAFIAGYDFPGYNFVPGCIIFKGLLGAFSLEVVFYKRFGNDYCYSFPGIRIVCTYYGIIEFWTDTQCCI